jgi:hypothetical protein
MGRASTVERVDLSEAMEWEEDASVLTPSVIHSSLRLQVLPRPRRGVRRVQARRPRPVVSPHPPPYRVGYWTPHRLFGSVPRSSAPAAGCNLGAVLLVPF